MEDVGREGERRILDPPQEIPMDPDGQVGRKAHEDQAETQRAQRAHILPVHQGVQMVPRVPGTAIYRETQVTVVTPEKELGR